MKNFLLSIAVIIFFSGISSFAETKDTSKAYYLGEVVVTADKDVITRSSSIEEISKSSINTTDAFNVSEAMNTAGGFYIRNNSKNENTLTVRGFDQRQIAVFFDGAPIYSAYDGTLDFGQFPVGAIGKITISKSMPSGLYGANSMGVTINQVSDEIRSGSKINALISGGTDYYSGSASYLGAYKSLFWNISADYLESDGFKMSEDLPYSITENGVERNNSGRKMFNAFIKAGYSINDNSVIAIIFNNLSSSKDVPTTFDSLNPRYWRYPVWDSKMLNVIYKSDFSDYFSVKANLYYTNYYNKLNSYDDATFSTQTKKYAFNSVFDDDAFGGNLLFKINTTILPPTKLTFQYKKDIHKEIDNIAAPEEKYEAETITVSGEQEFKLKFFPFIENFDFVAGAGYDILKPNYANGKTLRPNTSALNYYFGTAISLSDKLQLHGNIASRSRFPTLKELYAEILGKYTANDKLAPERTINVELGASYNVTTELTLKANIFISQISDLIQIINLPDNSRQFQNIGNASFKGIEVGCDYKSNIFNANINYTYLSAENTSAGADSKLIEYRPRHTANLTMNKNFNFGLSLQLEQYFYGYIHYLYTGDNKWHRLPDYYLMNIRIAQKIYGDFEIFARLNNLFDRFYMTEFGYPQPGRNIIIGIKLQI